MAGLADRLSRAASGSQRLSFDPCGTDQQRLLELPPEFVLPDPGQPRKDPGDVSELVASIRVHGLLQPIIAEPVINGRYRILAGHRRHAAWQLACPGKPIPSIIRSVHEQQRRELQLIENLQRQALLPLEEASAMRDLMVQHNLTQRQLGERLGLSEASICERLRILDLPGAIQERITNLGSDAPSRSVLVHIAKEADPKRQSALVDLAVAGRLTTQTVRKDRAAKKKRATTPSVRNSRTIETKNARILVTLASEQLATPVACIVALRAAIEILERGCPLDAP